MRYISIGGEVRLTLQNRFTPLVQELLAKLVDFPPITNFREYTERNSIMRQIATEMENLNVISIS